MIKFEPNPLCDYKYDYVRIFKDIAKGTLPRIPTYRKLTETDLFFVVYFVMEIPNANRPFVVERCKEVEATAEEGGWLDLWARYHFKSSVITKGLTIQRIFKYPERCTAIFSHTRPAAKKFLRSIKLLFESSTMLKKWYPDILYQNPVTESPKWSEDDGIIVKRKGAARSESTVEAWGLVEGMPTGSHFDYMMFDDIETDETVQTPEMVEKINSRFDLARNLKTEDGKEHIIGTPYSHLATYYPFLVEKRDSENKPVFRLRKHPAIDTSGNPVLLTKKQVADIRASTTRYVFNCQQMVDPTPTDAQRLDSSRLVGVEEKNIPSELYNFMVVDPAGEGDGVNADSWAFGVLGVEPKIDSLGQSKIFIKDLIIDTMTTPEAIESITKMYLRNGIIMRLGVEKTGQSTAEIHIANALHAKGRRVDVRDKTLVILKPAGRIKEVRIEQALSWPIMNGKIHYSRSIHPGYIDRLKTEMEKFPFWHDDGLDMLSYLYDMIKEYRFLPFNYETPKSSNKLAMSYAVR